MVRSVRNVWFEVDVDGYTSTIKGGPRSSDGGMTMTVYQRKEGRIMTAFKVHTFVNSLGEVVTRVDFGETESKIEIVTRR